MDIFFLPGFDISVQDPSLVDVHDSSRQLNEPISDEGLLETPPTLSPLSDLLVQISTLQESGMNEDLDFFCLSYLTQLCYNTEQVLLEKTVMESHY